MNPKNTPNSNINSSELTSTQKNDLTNWKNNFNSLLMDLMGKTGKNNAQIDLTKIWCDTNNLTEIYEQLSEMKQCLDSFRPFDSAMLKNFNEILDIKYTYESNSIEGNSLTLNETSQFLNTGLTIGGKPLVDHLEAINHQEAIQYIRELATNNIPLSEREIKNIHSLVLKGIQDHEAGQYRKQPVHIIKQNGDKYEFPQPFIIPKLMEEFFIFFNQNKDTAHPVEMAAHLHQKLVNIHPFIDGNGRTSRLIMNLFLFQTGYPIAVIESEMTKRKAYYNHLSDYQGVVGGGDSKPFQLFIAQKVKEAFIEQLNFFSQDGSNEGKDKGFQFFEKIKSII
ncbi:MAG: Fic family protein [Flavobacteriaceae bacterium]|nr:Fic family protein [Flavobacteriaceae bacterium]